MKWCNRINFCIKTPVRRSALPSGACCTGLVFATLSLQCEHQSQQFWVQLYSWFMMASSKQNLNGKYTQDRRRQEGLGRSCLHLGRNISRTKQKPIRYNVNIPLIPNSTAESWELDIYAFCCRSVNFVPETMFPSLPTFGKCSAHVLYEEGLLM
jgi:hypothetical protein